MIPDSIVGAMNRQAGEVRRDDAERAAVLDNIDRLSLSPQSEIGAFFINYSLAGVLSRRDFELLDICHPSPQIADATDFGRDVFDLPEGYICLTSGEGEQFIILSCDGGQVYDVGVEAFADLAASLISPRWNGFFDLMIWYLSED